MGKKRKRKNTSNTPNKKRKITIHKKKTGKFKSSITKDQWEVAEDVFTWKENQYSITWVNRSCFSVELACVVEKGEEEVSKFFYYYDEDEDGNAQWNEVLTMERESDETVNLKSSKRDYPPTSHNEHVGRENFWVEKKEGFYYYFRDRKSGEDDLYVEVFGGTHFNVFKKSTGKRGRKKK